MSESGTPDYVTVKTNTQNWETFIAKPHTAKAARYGQRNGQQVWNVAVAPGQHLLLVDDDFRERYAPSK